MRHDRLIQGFLFFIFSAILYTAGTSYAAFSTTDFQGTWYGHALTSGTNEIWEYYTITFDTPGNASVQATDSGGNTESESATFTITSGGIVSITDAPHLHGVMSTDKSIIVMTDTWDAGEYAFMILTKGGGSYTQSDLQGSWYGHGLSSGFQWEGWEYFDASIDSDGYLSIDFTDSDGLSESESNLLRLSIASNGEISPVGDADLHGVMSADKNLFVIVNKWEPGDLSIWIFTKGGGSFTQSDLQGTWYGHSLTSGSEEVWEYNTTTVDSQGAMTIEMTDPSGNTETDTASLSISGTGTVTVTGASGIHGVMGPDKDIIVFTETWSPGIFALSVSLKRDITVPEAAFSANSVTGISPLDVVFTDTSTGNITGWSWDFGDGSASTVQNPGHTYSKPGKYTVSLTVSGPDGSDTETKTEYIHAKSKSMPWISLLLADESPFEGTFNFYEQYDLNISDGIVTGTAAVNPSVKKVGSSTMLGSNLRLALASICNDQILKTNGYTPARV